MYSFSTLITEYDTPDGLIKMIENLDIVTLNHSIRVCEICKIIEKEMDFDNKDLSEAGLYHDIGKYFITTKLLNKRGKLNKIERLIIDSHSYLSYKILEIFGIKQNVRLLALYHHRFDVNMYFEDKIEVSNNIPEDIVKKAIILKTIDIFEALTTDRPYHRGISTEDAIKVIKETVNEYNEDTLKILLTYKPIIE